MARKPRIEFAGAVYHIISRGDRGEAIYEGDEDRERFLGGVGEVCERTGWKVHTFVLMTNHLLLETPEPNLSGRNEMASGHLYAALQPSAQPSGAPLSGAVQGFADRWGGAGLLFAGQQLYPSQSDESRFSSEGQGPMAKGAVEKQVLAWWLRKETVANRKWISQRLSMGDASRVTQAASLVNGDKDITLIKLRKRLEDIS